uniref:Uncharacterized protein n=1 Tax=Rhipicephalus zambeziensis TaxID=60191 RepID=A0A224YAM7_9ACAR
MHHNASDCLLKKQKQKKRKKSKKKMAGLHFHRHRHFGTDLSCCCGGCYFEKTVLQTKTASKTGSWCNADVCADKLWCWTASASLAHETPLHMHC